MCVYDPVRAKVLVGRERFGRYRGKYNICGGHVEPEDGGCLVEAARRELREEFKIGFPLQIDHTLFLGTKPVFCCRVDSSVLKAEELEEMMQRAVQDKEAPGSEKEMDDARWVCMFVENVVLSRFAKVTLKRLRSYV